MLGELNPLEQEAALHQKKESNQNADPERSVMIMSTSENVVYTSRVRIERKEGPMRLAYLPAEKEPVVFGVHSQIAEHYKVSPDVFPPHATTLDYVIAAAGG